MSYPITTLCAGGRLTLKLSPGILAPAVYGGEQVNLLPYFNGCLESTNVNNMPASVNFLDGGGAAPLMMNLPANSANSNQ